MNPCFRSFFLTILGLLFTLPLRLSAQAITVEAGRQANVIRPTEALGAGIDRLPYGAADKLFVPETITKVLAAGWQTVTYRQNTELHAEAWHWNPEGTWSDPSGKGYFTGNAVPGNTLIRHSYGYPLPHRGITRDDGTDDTGYSRLTDGDPKNYWKSNPYLSQAYTGEPDELHPQWVILDLSAKVALTAIRISWASPYARHYEVQYWTGDDPIKKPTLGLWKTFLHGKVTEGTGGETVLRLSEYPIPAQFVRILMTASSNTPDSHGAADKRNCVGYAIGEIYLGTLTEDGKFHDAVRHTADQDQTATYCSSVDPWHEPSDLDETAGDQVGFDLFFRNGFTRGLPAMIPIAMIYGTPQDAVAEISYIEKRGYPISYIEMGEEPDGHFGNPEDDAALYIQFSDALHKLDPKLRLGGPVFTGENEDIVTWPDTEGDTSWTHRFIGYLKAHHHLDDLAFFSFEHYPMDPGVIPWSRLYDENTLVTHIMKVWRDDGVPADVPLFITESNLCSADCEAYPDIWGGLWLSDYIGAFLAAGGKAVYFFHYLPGGMEHGKNNSVGTFNFFSAGDDLIPKQPLAQFFASQLINLEWIEPGSNLNRIYPAESTVGDGAGHTLVTAYADQRPDGQWSVMVVNKDQDNAHTLPILFSGLEKESCFRGPVTVTTFGKAQYQWHPAVNGGMADPDGPAVTGTVNADSATVFEFPAASITVVRGKVSAN